MRRSKTLRRLPPILIFVATAGLSPGAPCPAQEPKYELTPFAAYRIGGEFEDTETDDEYEIEDSNAFGLIFNIAARTDGQWELLYTRQSTDLDTVASGEVPDSIDLDVEYFHLGGTYLFEGDRTVPFIALTLGVTHFDPDFPGVDSENEFSASFGAGIRIKANDQLGIRLEGRVYTTFLDTDSRIFCSSEFGAAECLIQAEGTTLNQWEARAGLVFRF